MFKRWTIKGARRASLLFFALIILENPLCAYDLSQARVEKLQNGLTVMVLEDHTQPLVSTQMLYKVGARNECVGSTGLAHFVEHMAFRATKNFPDTEVVGRIYAVGGEWHGYTWIDETTYFETVPARYLDLVLRIQADRMTGALIRKEELEAERGAVITELHSYENDPASVLNDAVIAVSFLQHPYRYNTIGWTSDVQKITHSDLVNFYRQYYNPANAILSIAGDVNAPAVLELIHKYFDKIPAGDEAGLPRTVEPPQEGERRILLSGSGSSNYYQIAYRAPAARDPDFAAFLFLQAVLSSTGGVNFRQRGEGEPATPESRLHGIGRDIKTFFVPTADPYVFDITGSSDPSLPTSDIENRIEEAISNLREKGISEEELRRAREELLSELVFDIETTEDAAHEMAYFEGIGAFPILVSLPNFIRSVTTDDVHRVTQKYLGPHQRTIGWYLATQRSQKKALIPKDSPTVAGHKGVSPVATVVTEPIVKILKNGTIIIARRIERTPSGFLRALIPTNTITFEGDSSADTPVWRYTSVNWKFLKEDYQTSISQARNLFRSEPKKHSVDPAKEEDPEYRLERAIQELLGIQENSGTIFPPVISIVGDIDPVAASSLIEKSFRDLKPGKPNTVTSLQIKTAEKSVRLPGKAQSQLGYAVPAPSPSDPNSFAYRILLYILTHGYEGRLGKELIGKTGLIYYISSNYHSDGKTSWISMTAGVDPDKLKRTKELFEKLMQDLKTNPPTDAEIEEAKEHLIGRRITAYQSNEELSAFYVQEWIQYGTLLTQPQFEKRVRSVTREQVIRIIPKFLKGVTAVVDTNL